MTNRSRRQLGEYSLGKTLGAGSMGKVKLAISSVTGEKIAIKIIPRHTSLTAAQQQVEKSKELKEDGVNGSNYLEKAKIKDQGKEVRTIREASIVLLLHHPYVCGMKSMLVYPHHYYMLFEYVNGGQMLDYIISHGRLRERAARKFARQMGSALEYCHANSIVHRDLKIENILISKTGNIKIIDFGLSNLFSPNSNLQTFCGSLYFAAPELLNAKVYIGPEVDVWSFGIVLFVLVCGKVPFDDQSMPALHAKIKRGHVDYPTWLSSECKHILSRMLVTNPQNRASLTEVLSHPWMVKGFDGPPDSHIPHREPLRINEIQEEVVKGMTGFEFGTAEKIEADLRAVLTSELYQKVLKNHDSKRSRLDGHPDIYSSSQSGSSASMAANGIKKEHRGDRELPKATNKSAKRFSGFGFYGKKIAAVLGSNSTSKHEEKSNESNPLDTSVLLNGQSLDTVDPTRGFHPLISIYYLVREKIEREKIYGPGFFASSTLSVTGPPPPPAPPSAYKSAYSPTVPDFPDIRPPAAAAVNTNNDNPPPRSALKHRTSGYQTAEEDRNHRTRSSARPSTAVAVMSTAPKSAPASPARPGDETDHPRRSTQANAQRSELGSKPPTSRAERVLSMIETSDQAHHQSTSIAKRFGSFLGRSSSVVDPDHDYKRHRPRTSIGGSGHKSSTKTPLSALPQVTETRRIDPDDVPLSAPAHGKPVSRASTIGVPGTGAGTTKESSSTAANRTIPHSASAGSSWRPRLNSLHNPTSTPSEGEDQGTSLSMGNGGVEAPNANNCTTLLESEEEEITNHHREVEVENENERPESGGMIPSSKYQVEFSGRTASPSRGDKIKPIYLKGLFSVATTSTRGPQVLRTDLIKVLNRIGVQNREIKGGFECAHAPSIDLSRLGKGRDRVGVSNERVSSSSPPQESTTAGVGSAGGGTGGTGAMIKRKLSRGSFIENGGSDALSLSNHQKGNFSKKTKDDLVVRFEIFIVKMPLLPGINGLQFRRISGNVWQYQTFAKRILQELKL
ncbi:uncharacterized protein MELLADRAFT_115980 [Melampsora larici-populina 98AG31]|uniref:non-specific serine/threonine protein kinase n=1 Tax=Melampsora larici-populina (strain 98AG31 / pathotype 3-4-7) TaxID=747676 RepID=F4RGK0_MELLP|nr:uncharacterized protein MELLADRAFT_115980 [Melampsora larici-populina 98AG31]EGG08521.1 hypothetical protein MELLADRAFT_115980 [Melampsora larici-populina 98AG31]